MSDDNITDIDLLAAEHVLGTLSGRDRAEFQREIANNPDAALAVQRWEERLMALAMALNPVEPDPDVWSALEQRIQSDRVVAMPAKPAARPWLTAWASLATAASVALATVLVLQPEPTPRVEVVERAVSQQTYVAYLKMPDVDMHWTVSMEPDSRKLRVRAGGTPPDAAAGNDTELWWLGPDGPVSLGVIPVAGASEAILPQTIKALRDRKLAVSLEPSGGSPTGQPTGPVIAVGEIVEA